MWITFIKNFYQKYASDNFIQIRAYHARRLNKFYSFIHYSYTAVIFSYEKIQFLAILLPKNIRSLFWLSIAELFLLLF